MIIKSKKSNTRVLGKFEEIYPETGLKLIRPQILWWRVLFSIIITFAIDLFAYFGAKGILTHLTPSDFVIESAILDLFIVLFIVFVTFLLVVKRIVLFSIRLYQSQAPYTIRCKCLYSPNCSEYMYLAIQKYGLIKGLIKGIERFNRCKPPYGGVDYP